MPLGGPTTDDDVMGHDPEPHEDWDEECEECDECEVRSALLRELADAERACKAWARRHNEAKAGSYERWRIHREWRALHDRRQSAVAALTRHALEQYPTDEDQAA